MTYKMTILMAAAAAVLAVGQPVLAQETAPTAGSSFKRIGVPQAGSSKRITIQIAPEDDWYRRPPEPEPEPQPAVEEETAAATPPSGAAPDKYARFWQGISPHLDDSSGGRLETALVVLSHLPEITGPRLDDIRRITDAYGKEILRHTVGTRVSPALVAAIISVESSGRVDAVRLPDTVQEIHDKFNVVYPKAAMASSSRGSSAGPRRVLAEANQTAATTCLHRH